MPDQQRHGQKARQHARNGEVFHRVGRQRGQRVDLLGDLHRGDFGGDGGGDAGGDHQADQHRAKFAHHADGDDLRHHGLGGKALAAGVDLQGQRAAGEDRGEADDRQRQPADLHQGGEKFATVERRADDVGQGDGRIDRDAAHGGQSVECGAAKAGEAGFRQGKQAHAVPS